MKLPDFSLHDYTELLREIAAVGGTFHVISDLRNEQLKDIPVLLRHDIDCHPEACLEMAKTESAEGVRATYYVLLTAHYNPKSRMCSQAIRQLTALGHEVGLHYDLRTYPEDPVAAAVHLRVEAERLAEISTQEVRTISCHQPHMGLPDPFIASVSYVNCHDPDLTGGLRYVSDSCRGWRDDGLVAWLQSSKENPKCGLQLLTHPELWHAGEIADRMQYLEEILSPLVLQEAKSYVSTEMADLWLQHQGAKLHDMRLGIAR